MNYQGVNYVFFETKYISIKANIPRKVMKQMLIYFEINLEMQKIKIKSNLKKYLPGYENILRHLIPFLPVCNNHC